MTYFESAILPDRSNEITIRCKNNMSMMSEHTDQLFTALAKAQADIGPAFKNKNNPFHKSNYADLESIWEACRGPLSANGLSVVQLVNQDNNGMILSTFLGHSSGQWMKSEMPIKYSMEVNASGKKPNEIQQIGSSISYCKRYALSAIAGVPVSDIKRKEIEDFDDDDDGNCTSPSTHAHQNHAPEPKYQPKTEPKPRPPEECITKEQADELKNVLKNCSQQHRNLRAKILANAPHNVKDLAQMPKNIYVTELELAKLNAQLTQHMKEKESDQESH